MRRLLLLVLFAGGCGVIETSPDPRLIGDEDRRCDADAQCRKVDAGCCGCGGGGDATAISTEGSAAVAARREVVCGERSCPAMVSDSEACTAGEPACVDGRCELVGGW